MGEKMQFSELDQYLFGQGTHYDIYKKLGAHPTVEGRKKGVYFAVWAPNAQSVSVIGDFNKWDIEADPMKKAGPIGVFEVFVPGAKMGIFINSILWACMEKSFIRRIRMPTRQNFVREQLPELRISALINGKMQHG